MKFMLEYIFCDVYWRALSYTCIIMHSLFFISELEKGVLLPIDPKVKPG